MNGSPITRIGPQEGVKTMFQHSNTSLSTHHFLTSPLLQQAPKYYGLESSGAISFILCHLKLALAALSLGSAALTLCPLVPSQKDCGETKDCFCLVSLEFAGEDGN